MLRISSFLPLMLALILLFANSSCRDNDVITPEDIEEMDEVNNEDPNDDSNNDSNDSSNQPGDSSGTLINSNLSGSIFGGNGLYVPVLMDVSSGTCAIMPSSEWDDNPNYSDFADYSAHISLDGTEILETIDRCEGYPEEKACFIIRDKSGNVLTDFSVVADLSNTAKLSPDKSMIAFLSTDDDWNTHLEVYSRTGQFLGSVVYDEIQSFDWHPANFLVYSTDNHLYGFIAGDDPVYFTTLSGEGIVGQISLNSEGTKLAYKRIVDGTLAANYGNIYVFNFETGSIDRVAVGTNEEPNLNWPIWSPDGEWIALLLGGQSGSTQGNLFIVPANGKDVLVDLNAQTEAIPIFSYFHSTDSFNLGIGSLELSQFFGSKGPGNRWLP